MKTRNRKRLKRPTPFGAAWELRCGPNNRFRVFYTLILDRRQVIVLVIARKERNKVLVGNEELLT